MHFTRRLLILGAAVFLASFVFFTVGIQFPRGHCFDEFHTVPEARELLEGRGDPSLQQPPLGKYLIAAGIALDTDRPFGWRWMSAFFGALTLTGMFAWALFLFHNVRTALWVAGITAVNQLLFVQSRIAMPDTFLVAFLVWACALYTLFWTPSLSRRRARQLLTWCGILFGLAAAVKWFAIVPWLLCLALFALVRGLQRWDARFEAPSDWGTHLVGHREWYSANLWSNVRDRHFWGLMLGVPIATYLACFLPLLFLKSPNYGFWDLFSLQADLWRGHTQLKQAHPYSSHWMQWPLMLKPIWYAFDKEGAGRAWVRGVVLLGNPLVMWGGLAAAVFCGWAWIKHRSLQGFLILAFYLVFWLSWTVVPDRTTFYYCYYPAALMLSLSLGYAFHALTHLKQRLRPLRWMFLGVAAALFLYFYPILAAQRIPTETFRSWMWLSSWV